MNINVNEYSKLSNRVTINGKQLTGRNGRILLPVSVMNTSNIEISNKKNRAPYRANVILWANKYTVSVQDVKHDNSTGRTQMTLHSVQPFLDGKIVSVPSDMLVRFVWLYSEYEVINSKESIRAVDYGNVVKQFNNMLE